MGDDVLERIDKRLEQLVKLQAIGIGKDLTLTQRIVLLSRVGFKPIEIADVLGTNRNVVNVRLSEARKKGELK